VIVIEALSRMMLASTNEDFITGFLMGARNDDLVFVSYLLFADDTLIFCGTVPYYFSDDFSFPLKLLQG
jgi:hypothetical protein